MTKHRVAVVQASASVFDTSATLERMEVHCDAVRSLGVELAVFPEAYIGGYPKGLDFGARVGGRTPAGRDDFRRYWDAAINVPGPETSKIAELASKTGAFLVVGVIERSGGTLYCTALFFSAQGELVGKHRKLMPTASERLIWGFGDGSTMPVIQTPLGKVGAAICWENYMPPLRQSLYAKGINIWCAPTVDDREIWQSSMRHIAYEGRTFVLSACQYLTQNDFPEPYRHGAINTSKPDLISGGSVIVGPFGDVLAGPIYGKEDVLTADIDLDDVARGKYDLDVVGHYSRPDIFKLSVNEAPLLSVKFTHELEVRNTEQDVTFPLGPNA
jgi:nitrilase